MSTAERFAYRPAPRAGNVALAVGVLLALCGAMLPLLRVVSPGDWVAGAVLVPALVMAAGVVARRYRLPAVAITLIEAAVWTGLTTLIFLRDTALLLIVPTPATVEAIPVLLQTAVSEITLGAAPLPPSLALSLVIVGAMGLLAIVLDHVVITARLPLVAAVGVIAVSLIPSIAVPDEADVVSFALLAASILFLVRVETRTRQAVVDEPAPRPSQRASSTSAMALGIGAVAVVVALAVTPLLPQPSARAGGTFGVTGSSINPSLRLGDDLRRPREVEALTLRTTAATPPYLRVATLSMFNGRVWAPDRGASVPLEEENRFGALGVDEGIVVNEFDTTVEIQGLQSPYLPIPFPAVEVGGLDGDWAAVPYNRTVIGARSTNGGMTYNVHTQVARPTLEQIRSRSSVGSAPDEGTLGLPDDMPPVIAELAREVTADADNDYDRLTALQSWFRGSTFTYSLEAPVDGGFDGTGANAVARFLDVREGYCQHFAAAFALMARTLDMPSRIVVGYLPGSSTSTTVDDRTVYSVSSSQVHAWPEVYFEGIGWVAFDPTKSLGVATAFSSGTTAPGGAADPGVPTTTPSDAAAPVPSASLNPDDPLANEMGSGTVTARGGGWPWGWTLLGVGFVLLMPGIVRELRRRRLLAAARRGDASAAWLSVQEAAIDLGIPVPAAESPRGFGARLTGGRHVDPRAVDELVRGIERASYAPAGTAQDGRPLADAATAVRASLLASVGTGERLAALLLPRSLVIRPGSVYAGSLPAGAGRGAISGARRTG